MSATFLDQIQEEPAPLTMTGFQRARGEIDMEATAAFFLAEQEIAKIDEFLPAQKRETYREACGRLYAIVRQLQVALRDADLPRESRAYFDRLLTRVADRCECIDVE